MQKDEALQFLTQELDYTPEKAQSVWSDLSSSDVMIQEAFNKLVNGEDIQIEVEDYTVERLTEEYRMTPVAALLTLDWLIKEPDTALKALSEGYDVVM